MVDVDFDLTVSKRVQTETDKGTGWKITLSNKDLGHSLTMSMNEADVHSFPIGSTQHLLLKNPQTTLEEASREDAASEIRRDGGVPVLLDVEHEGENDDGEDNEENQE